MFCAPRSCKRGGLDAPQNVEPPAVLEPDLVVQEPPELVGKLADGRLGALGGVKPVVVDMPRTNGRAVHRGRGTAEPRVRQRAAAPPLRRHAPGTRPGSG